MESDGLMGSVAGEILGKAVEGELLSAAVGCGPTGSLTLKRAVQVFMSAILLGLAGLDQLQRDGRIAGATFDP